MGSADEIISETTFVSKRLSKLAFCAIASITGIAHADSVPDDISFSSYSRPNSVILAVSAPFAMIDGNVRLTVYDSEADFLETPVAKFQASIDSDGLAILDLGPITAGDYAFVAYYDENKDGKLNRNALGIPKEPFAFSNEARAKLRKPRFEEAKVEVNTGSVVVIELKD